VSRVRVTVETPDGKPLAEWDTDETGRRYKTLELWVDARTAALYLRPCMPKHLNEEIGPMLTRESANRPGTVTARSGGWRYHRHDLERVRAIMDAVGCKPLKAAWLFHALKQLRKRELVDWLLEPGIAERIEQQTTEVQLDIADQLRRTRRREKQ
jgi:hypothetical protein